MAEVRQQKMISVKSTMTTKEFRQKLHVAFNLSSETYFVIEYFLPNFGLVDPIVIDVAPEDFTNAYIALPPLSQLTVHRKLQ